MRRAAPLLALVAAATADGNATSKCEPFRVVSDHNGFGNAIFALYRAFAQAQRSRDLLKSSQQKHDRLSHLRAPYVRRRGHQGPGS